LRSISTVMVNRDTDSGKYTGEYSRDDFLSAIKNQEGPIGTGEVAKTVGCAHDTAYKRLKLLEKEDVVRSQKIGNTLIWEILK